jgi:hypothetical protein
MMGDKTKEHEGKAANQSQARGVSSYEVEAARRGDPQGKNGLKRQSLGDQGETLTLMVESWDRYGRRVAAMVFAAGAVVTSPVAERWNASDEIEDAVVNVDERRKQTGEREGGTR